MSVSTKVKILDAAETLFAENGYSDTSLRQITSLAEVNLASVNYHFGSKKDLIQQVLDRYLEIAMPALDRQMQELSTTTDTPTLDQVFTLHKEPLLAVNSVKPNGTSIYLKLLGRGYAESQGHLRRYIYDNYGDTLDNFVALVHCAYPTLPSSEIFWRLHFTLGTAVFTTASFDALSDIAQSDFDQTVTIEALIQKIIPFMSAGFASPFNEVTD